MKKTLYIILGFILGSASLVYAATTIPWLRNGSLEFPNYPNDDVTIGQTSTSSKAKLEVRADTTSEGAFTALGSSTLQNFTAQNSTSTNATSSTLGVTTLTSCDTIDTGADGSFHCGTDATGGGGSGVGTVATSSLEVRGQIPYWTTSSAYPALLGTVGTSSIANGTGITVTNGSSAYVIGAQPTVNCNTATGSVFGCLTATDWLTFNNKVGTSTVPNVGGLAYWTSAGTPSLLGTVATGTVSGTNGITVTSNRYAVGGALAIDCTVASGSNAGCLSTSDWTTFNNKESALTFSSPLSRSVNTISFLFNTNNTWTGTNLFQNATNTAIGLTVLNGTTTNATSTNLFATNASTTNATSTNFFASKASTTQLRLATGACDTLDTDSTGLIICGTDATGSGGSVYAFPNQLGGGNATSSLTGFSGGLLSLASTTIGDGTIRGGLTVSGGATTTGTTTLGALYSNVTTRSRLFSIEGNCTYPRFVPTGGDNSSYLNVTKCNTASDASLLLSDQGAKQWEIGLAGDNNLSWKTISGSEALGTETFTTVFFMNHDSRQVGIGTVVPTGDFELASSTSASRTQHTITNKSSSGSKGAQIALFAQNAGWAGYIMTDVGLNGNQNLGINWGTLGVGIFMDSSGNIGIQNSGVTTGSALTVTGQADITKTLLISTSTGSLSALTIASSTAPQISLSASTAGVNNWVLRNAGGVFALATSTVTATSSKSAFIINANGFPSFSSLAGVGCAQFDANGTLSNTGSACGSGGGGTPNSKWATSTGVYLGITPNGGLNVNVGIGTSTPVWPLTVSSSTGPQIALTDASTASNGWTIRNAGGNLYFATSSPTTFSTSTTAGLSLVQSSTNGSISVGTTTPWGILNAVSNYKNVPLFVLATGTDMWGQMVMVRATSTTLLGTVSGGDNGVRFGIGTTTLHGFEPLDQLTVDGRINPTWRQGGCDLFNNQIAQLAGDTASICAGLEFVEDTAAVADLGVTDTRGGDIYARIRTGTAGVTSAASDGGGISGLTAFLTSATNTPVMEVTARKAVMANASSSLTVIGFANYNGVSADYATPPTSGCYFEASSTATNWWFTAKNGGAASTVDTGIASSTSVTGTGKFNKFRIELDSTRCTGYLTQGGNTNYLKFTTSSQVPTTALLNPTASIADFTTAGLAKELHVRTFRFWFRGVEDMTSNSL